MISFLVPLIIILLANATSVFIFKKSFLKTLIFTLLLFSFPLFISGILFKTFKIGYLINIIYSLTILILLILNRKNSNVLNEFKNNYFTLGLYMFLFVYIFVYIYDFNRVFTMWDEKSHWGVMLKEMIRLDNFYSINKSTLMVHKDYPPILQLFELFWIKLSGTYKETYALRAFHTLELTVLIQFIDEKTEVNFKNIIKSLYKVIMIILIGLLIILMFDMHGIINSIYNDYFISLLVAYILIYILFKNDNSNFYLINLSLLLSFLLLTKQVALSFYLMAIFLYLIVNLKNKKNIKMILLLIIVPFIFYKIWGIYISKFEIDQQFLISDIKLNELKDIIFNVSNEKHIIFQNFISSIFRYKLSFFKYFNITYINAFILFTILLFIISKLKVFDKKNLLKLFLTIFIGNIGYLVLMLILYLFCFKNEGYTLASFDRYMDTYILIEFIIIFIFVIKYLEIKNKIKIYFIICLILLISIDSHRFHYLKPAIKKVKKTKEEIVADIIMKKTKKTDKIFLVSQDTNSTYQFSVKYYANPRITNLKYYEYPINDIDYEKYFYEEVNDYMLDYDYLYVVNTTNEINEKYNFIFKNMKNGELYEIKKIEGKVNIKLVK